MTLREAVGRAVAQNPDVTLARLEEVNARHAVQIAKDPFAPRVVVGSGLAYSNGFPMSIEGSAPSIVQAHATQYLFNRQQSYAVAQAKEQVRGAGFDVASKRDEVAYRTASLYLDAERAARVLTVARKDAESLQTVLSAIQAQVKEGRALPLAEKQAALQAGSGAATGGDTGRGPGERGDAAGDRGGVLGGRPGASGGGGAARGGAAGIGRTRGAIGAGIQQGAAQTAIADCGEGVGDARREGGAVAARRPGGAIRAVRQIQQLRGLLPHLPAEQRTARGIFPAADIQRSGHQGADVADRDGHHAPEGAVEQRAKPDQRGFAAIVPRREEGRAARRKWRGWTWKWRASN